MFVFHQGVLWMLIATFFFALMGTFVKLGGENFTPTELVFYRSSISLVFIMATIVSFYHFGIEQGFIKESLVCDLSNKNSILTTEELLKELTKKTISCKEVTFKILGLSLATINTIISLILSIIVTNKILNYEKN